MTLLLATSGTVPRRLPSSVAAFAASSVEMVEALTLVVAAGTRSWRSAFEGTAAALVLLAVLTASVGAPSRPLPAHRRPPRHRRRPFVAHGHLLAAQGDPPKRRPPGETRRGCHLRPHGRGARREGGSGEQTGRVRLRRRFQGRHARRLQSRAHRHQPRVELAQARARSPGGRGGGWVVAAVGVLAARQLSEVPENTLKTVVGIMLTSFGTFWVGKGPACPGRAATSPPRPHRLLRVGRDRAGLRLPATDRRPQQRDSGRCLMGPLRRSLRASAHFAWDFLVGDTPEVIITTGVLVALAFALHTHRIGR